VVSVLNETEMAKSVYKRVENLRVELMDQILDKILDFIFIRCDQETNVRNRLEPIYILI
jgi:hypothetical protein